MFLVQLHMHVHVAMFAVPLSPLHRRVKAEDFCGSNMHNVGTGYRESLKNKLHVHVRVFSLEFSLERGRGVKRAPRVAPCL